MPAVHECRYHVQPTDIDDQGHVNNLEYLKWMQTAAVEHSAVQGWPPERYVEEGSAWVVRSHWIEYQQPAFEGDEIVVRTWVANFKKVLSLRKFQIERPADNTILAIAETNWAYIGTKHRVPRRIPKELIEAFEVIESLPTADE
ncbi:MAG: thioesterase [Planctomycetaceae bacterium]|nr:thioesterase [Planctomycetaceae bacterium]